MGLSRLAGRLRRLPALRRRAPAGRPSGAADEPAPRPHRRSWLWLPRPPLSPAQETAPGYRPPPASRWRRALAAALAVAEAGLLGGLLADPAFAVHRVRVVGADRLGADQVIAIAGLEHPGSIFTLASQPVQDRLEGSVWVRSASVTPSLPDQVTVRVEEWQPVAVYHAGEYGRDFYLSERAIALGPAEARPPGGLVRIAGPPGPDPIAGRPALDPGLLVALVDLQRQLPGLIGQRVASYQIDGCGNLTMLTARGWRAQFGRVGDSGEMAGLEAKVAALQAAAARVDYGDPRLDYVNVMNPAVVAVHDRAPGPPAPAPPPSPSPACA